MVAGHTTGEDVWWVFIEFGRHKGNITGRPEGEGGGGVSHE